MINLKYWKCAQNNGNFGDELSPLIVSHFLNPNFTLTHNQKGESMIAVGSYIHYAESGDTIWGSGVRTNPPQEQDATHDYTDLKVFAVRGHLTKQFLESKGIKVPEIYGDPALLLPHIIQYNPIPELSNSIAIVPHCSQIDKYSGFRIINPLDDCKEVVRKIYSSKAIISSSLHGLIVADAYNIPNVWLNGNIDEGDFKFRDYFTSQGRPCEYINSIEEFDESKLYRGGNRVDLQKLINSFPYVN